MRRKLDWENPNSRVGPLTTPCCCPVSRQRGARWHLLVSYVSLGNGVRDALFEVPLWPPVLIFFEPLTLKPLSFFLDRHKQSFAWFPHI